MTVISKYQGQVKVVVETIEMGNDLSVCIYGGDIPHIGAVALGVSRPSLKDPERFSSTVSVLAITGHKEDELAKYAANLVSASLNKTVVVSCGIHIDDITSTQLKTVGTLVEEALNELIDTYKNPLTE